MTEPSATPETAAPAFRRSRWRRRMLLVLVIVTGTAAALEVGARAFFPSPFAAEGDLVGMYQNAGETGSVRTVPGWEGEFTVEGRTVPVRLDALGLRSPEIGPRQPGELRVLCLGDSFVFGYGVAGEEAFPEVLQGLLAQQLGRPVVTGNAGVPGYGTVEQARCLRRLAPDFDPDVVVSTIYLGNDFLDDQVSAKYVVDGFCMGGDWAALLRRSARARFMLTSRAWMKVELSLIEAGSPWALQPVPSAEETAAFAGFPPRSRPNQCVADLFMDVIDPQRSWDAAQPAPVVPRVLDTVRQSLSAIRATAGRAPVLVVLMPTWWHVSEPDRLTLMRKVRLDPAEYRTGLTQQRLEEVCAGLQLPVIDLTPRLHDDAARWFLQEDRHLNAEGQRLVAETLAPAIAALLR